MWEEVSVNKNLTNEQKRELRLRTLACLYMFEDDYMAEEIDRIVGDENPVLWQRAKEYVRDYIERVHRTMGFVEKR